MEYPGNRGFLGRKRSVDFTNTTLKTFFREIPAELYKHNDHKKTITFVNGSEILYGGLDDEREIVKFNSMELGFFGIDQAEEISYDDFAALCGTLRHKLLDGREPKYRGLLTCNPRVCWLKDKFILNPEPDYHFIPALPKDNPYLPSDYVNKLREVLKHRPKLLKAYIEGSWDELEDGDIIIPYNIVCEAIERPVSNLGKPKTIISCDPAAMGEDETVIYVIKNLRIIDQRILGYSQPMEIVGHLALLYKQHKADLIVIDSNGVGAGMYSRLVELGLPVIGFSAAEKATEKDKYKNLKAEAWFVAADKFQRREVSIQDDDLLKGQLAGVKFKPYEDKLEVEKSEDTKRRLGRSPDRATALVMGLWAYEKIAPFNSEFLYEEYERANYNREIRTRTGYG